MTDVVVPYYQNRPPFCRYADEMCVGNILDRFSLTADGRNYQLLKQQGLQRPFESNRISRASKVRPSPPPLSDWRPAARGKRRHSRRIFSGIGDSVWLSSASNEGIWKGTRCQATWWLQCRLLGANAAGQVSIPQMWWFSIREAVGICSASWKAIVSGLFSLIPSINRADANANDEFLAVLPSLPRCPTLALICAGLRLRLDIRDPGEVLVDENQRLAEEKRRQRMIERVRTRAQMRRQQPSLAQAVSAAGPVLPS